MRLNPQRNPFLTQGPAEAHPEYPIERVCTHRYEAFQLSFARRAQQLFPDQEDLELLASHQGLTIRGETEDAIDGALAVLEDCFGPQIKVGPPVIRYHKGATMEQPWMGLRVRCSRDHVEPVKVDLIVRDGMNVTSELWASGAIVQGCAPLAYLLGYGSTLRKLTSGSARHVMWLSHYAPVENSPPGGDAA